MLSDEHGDSEEVQEVSNSYYLRNTKVIPMTEEQISQLKEENAYLKTHIRLLSQQNELFRSILADVQKGNGIPNVITSYVEKVIGSSNAGNADVEKVIGISTNDNSHVEKVIGSTSLSNTYVENDKGSINANPPHVEKDMGITNILLPPAIGLTQQNRDRLYRAMPKSEFFRVKKEACKSMAAILIQAYNNGDCSYTALKSVANRSEGGIAKLVASLKKRGLITKAGWQKFKPTEKALGYFRMVRWVG